MNRKTAYLIALMLFLIVSSCDEDSEPALSESPIVETTLPESAEVGSEITFTIHHAVFNGCGYYANQNTTRTGKELYVTFYAGYRGRICSMNIPILETNYSYTFNEPGVYTFNFNKGEGEYLIETITVN